MMATAHAASVDSDVLILVVEHESIVRFATSDELRRFGFEVIEACNGEEAVGILGAGAPVDLILSDMRMPGAVDGFRLLDYTRATHPEVPVIITSGHLTPDEALARGAQDFLPKPYSPGESLAAIRRSLESSPT